MIILSYGGCFDTTQVSTMLRMLAGELQGSQWRVFALSDWVTSTCTRCHSLCHHRDAILKPLNGLQRLSWR
jgi:hypothetical protein